jgi:multiple sugar transport system substrate-binding protein
MKRRRIGSLVGLFVLLLLIAACTPEEVAVEVTRVVTELEEVEVPVEVTRVITETIEVEGQPVEVTRIVEVAPEPDFPEGTELNILQWSHFVPQYDRWFDPFAQEWGETNGVAVTVDHIDQAQLIATLTAAIDAGEGPTLVELIIAPSLFVEGIHDLTDVNLRAQEMFGEQVETCRANSYLPARDMYYGFCHAWVPDPGDYDIAMWTQVGLPNGPTTYEELLTGGAAIREQLGVPMGLGLAPEIDSNMAMRAIMWSYGGSIQDENECVVVNSPENVAAVEYLTQLYQQTMTEEVFAWNAASNNQGLIAGELSYILNSISAYRSLQKIDPAAADNIGFVEALSGPDGLQHASAHLWSVYVIPNYVEDGSPEMAAAKEFMLHLVSNYNQATFNSELYNFPAFPSTVPQLTAEGGWLDVDPFGSRPANKLQVLRTAEEWVTHLGYPGPANPAEAEVYATHIIPTMMGRAALGELTPEEAVAWAEEQIVPIFDKWRERGYIGCDE